MATLTYGKLLKKLGKMTDKQLAAPVVVEDSDGYAFLISKVGKVYPEFDVDVEAEIGMPLLEE